MQLLRNFFKLEKAYAHCDIPCGIYDPHLAQVSAFTVLRMASLINLLDKSAADYDHKFSRYVTIKEEHAELCKHEIRIIWGDYFKPANHGDHFNKAQELTHKIMLLGSKNRQEISETAANDLITTVNEFSEVFWATKNVSTTKLNAPYPTGGQMVVPKA
ncbi:MAG: Superoxide dismutase [Ni] precursor [Candidatus Heimdallarchaeota archaeon LC_3]|nr:MAG: Superoxide dismutase [Ni] precursor [Candidatus Heimdallarchaeota archaeon LC_3]